MTNTRVAFAWVALLLLTAADPARSAEAEPVAVIATLSGPVSVVSPPGTRRDAALFDWLPAGATVDTGKEGRATLAFAVGRRFELGSGARVTLSGDGFSAQSGPITALPPVPPLPRLAALADGGPASSSAGVIRIRGKRIGNLYPRAGTRVLHDRATLRFTPLSGLDRYSVDVEDEAGVTVFQANTEGAAVTVPANSLRPGARYYWRVRGLVAEGASSRGHEEFETVDAEQARARRAIAEDAAKSGEAAALALLAAVDRALGLLQEAREDLQAAVQRAPQDQALRQALAGMDAELGGQ